PRFSRDWSSDVCSSDLVKAQASQHTFMYGTLLDVFSIMVNSVNYNANTKIDLEQISEESLNNMESQGAQDIVVFRDKFVTPNGAEGLKTYGSLKLKHPISQKMEE